MRAFERLSHEVRVAYAFEAVVRAATGQLDQMRDQIAFDAFRIDEVRHAELTGKTLARRIAIDANDLVGTDHLRALEAVEADAAKAEHDDVGAGFALCRDEQRAAHGRASGRERVGKYVSISVGAV